MDRLQLPKNTDVAMAVVQNQTRQRQLELESGLLGRIFGSGRNAPIQIVGMLLVLLVISALAYTFLADASYQLTVAEFWRIVTPLITALAGFLFGTYSKLA